MSLCRYIEIVSISYKISVSDTDNNGPCMYPWEPPPSRRGFPKSEVSSHCWQDTWWLINSTL